jgi:hypothetical protein
VVDLLVATFATKGFLHFRSAVEQLEVCCRKELAFLILAFTDDDFKEVKQAGEVDR